MPEGVTADVLGDVRSAGYLFYCLLDQALVCVMPLLSSCSCVLAPVCLREHPLLTSVGRCAWVLAAQGLRRHDSALASGQIALMGGFHQPQLVL